MKLLDGGRVPNARRVRVFLAEKGISVPLEQVDITRMEHKSDAFTQLNPMQRVPVLILDDGTALAESVAICRYFEEIHPAPALFGTGAKQRALVDMWQRRCELELLLAAASVFRHLHPAMAAFEVPQVAAWGEANKPRVARFLAVMDSHLAGSAYVAGADFSIADITLIIGLDFMKPAKLAVPEGLSHLARWRADVSARPSMAA